MFLPDWEYSCLLNENSGTSIPHKGWNSGFIHDGSGNIHVFTLKPLSTQRMAIGRR